MEPQKLISLETLIACLPRIVANCRVRALADHILTKAIAVPVGETKMKWCVALRREPRGGGVWREINRKDRRTFLGSS